MLGRHLCLVLRLLKALGARHGLARCLPVHSPDALDAGTRGGAADGAALSGGGQKKCLAGIAVQGEVDQLGRPVAFDENQESFEGMLRDLPVYSQRCPFLLSLILTAGVGSFRSLKVSNK